MTLGAGAGIAGALNALSEDFACVAMAVCCWTRAREDWVGRDTVGRLVENAPPELGRLELGLLEGLLGDE